MKKKIIILNTGPFPEGDAGAVRLRFMGRALVEAGYEVEVLCRGNVNDAGWTDGIHYISLKKTNSSRTLRGIDYCLFPSRVKRYLRSHKDTFCIYLYYAQNSLFEFCKRFSKKNGIMLVHDCVEWYSPDEFKKGEKSKVYQANNRLNTQIIDKSFRVIAISRYLEKHFSEKGIPTIRVPILYDSENSCTPKQNKDVLTLFYAGLPGRKDYIGNILQAAVLLTKEEQKNLRIILVGATREYLIHACDISEKLLDDCAAFLQLQSRVPRQQVLTLMESADFTVLPRDASRRYAMAGFPTKVVESLSNATPVICNYSSDLELYLHDGENALIAVDHTPEELVKTLRRAFALTADEKHRMSISALESAKKYFDFRKYSEKLKKFFEN